MKEIQVPSVRVKHSQKFASVKTTQKTFLRICVDLIFGKFLFYISYRKVDFKMIVCKTKNINKIFEKLSEFEILLVCAFMFADI